MGGKAKEGKLSPEREGKSKGRRRKGRMNVTEESVRAERCEEAVEYSSASSIVAVQSSSSSGEASQRRSKGRPSSPALGDESCGYGYPFTVEYESFIAEGLIED